MDYKDKYIKYKTKYLELKNIEINNLNFRVYFLKLKSI